MGKTLENTHRIFVIIGVIVAVIGGGGIIGWRTNQQEKLQTTLPKTEHSTGNEIKTVSSRTGNSTVQENTRVVEPSVTVKRDPIFPKKCDVETGAVGIAASAKECIEIGNTYRLDTSSERFVDLKVVIPEDGNLTLSLETFAEKTWFTIFDKSGKSFDPSISKIVNGRRASSTIDRGMKISFNRGDKFVPCGWNVTGQTFTGNYTFTLDAGTYYVRILRGLQGLSKAHLSVEFKEK